MDMFRHYHREITGSSDYISDKKYAYFKRIYLKYGKHLYYRKKFI